jgi:hypothetical protein
VIDEPKRYKHLKAVVSNVFEFRRAARRKQLREIAEACKLLEDRTCKCGCGIKFRVLPDSELVYGTDQCAKKAGWRPKYLFGPGGVYQIDRRWVWHTPGISAPVATEVR